MPVRSMIPALCAVALLACTAAPASAQNANATITIRDHHFAPAELKVPANKPIMLKVVNEDATPEEFESKEFKAEKVIAGKSQATIRIAPLKPGHYKFFGEYHEDTAQGVLIAE